MPACSQCSAAVPDTARFCPECGAPAAGEDPAVARTVQDDSSSRPPSSVHGRFEPGTRLGTRYRIVGLLGRGGMGEVYRADDLELDQAVALKFLPEQVAADSVELERLRKEVRIAREISHPNVCRTYDISEADGQVFLVMEYVDGEDLVSVLRRMGRPTSDKAVEIARQLALGLGAAHDNGVLHRDLKPANVMIDGRGRVRITDFGLAGLAEEFAHDPQHAGTPAYMAPEQLEGKAATVSSDIYALGLTLYEVFTGKRAFDSKDPAEIRRLRSESSVTSPSKWTPEIDPAVERLLLQCLESDPAQRPQSAYSVLGALPGGDPLAAALAAGETPSPELVASTGGEGRLRPRTGVMLLVVALGFLTTSVILQQSRYALLDESAAALELKAEQVLAATGITDPPRYTAAGFIANRTAQNHYAALDSAGVQVVRRPEEYPSRQAYFRRWSREELHPRSIHEFEAGFLDPPFTGPGSATVVLDGAGRLMALQIQPPTDDSQEPTDWSALLPLAGYDPEHLTRASVDAGDTGDSTVAWLGKVPGDSARVELWARGKRGRLFAFWVTGSWGSTRELKSFEDPPGPYPPWALSLLFVFIPLAITLILARHNIRMGRGDRQGANRLAIAIFATSLIAHVFSLNLSELGLGATLIQIIFDAPMAHCLLHAAGTWIAYVAIEPYLRRLWPHSLVSWARLTSGRFRDPIVGRDILLGAVTASFFMLSVGFVFRLADLAGYIPQWVVEGQLGRSILGIDQTLASAAENVAASILFALTLSTLLLLLRLILRKNLLAAAGLCLLVTVIVTIGFVSSGVPFLPFGALFGAVIGLTIGATVVRLGLLSTSVFVLMTGILATLPFTTDLSTWRVDVALVGPALLLGLLLFAFSTALGGQSLLKDVLGESG